MIASARSGRCAGVLVVLAAAGTISFAQSYYLAVDVDTKVGGWSVPTETINVRSTFRWDRVLSLPEGVEISALHLDTPGVWAFSPSTPFEADGTVYRPDEVVITDGLAFGSIFDGQAAGLPAGVGIDAIMESPSAGMVLSLDAPAEWGGFQFMPGDLIDLGVSITPYWIASTNGVPAWANVVGAHETPEGLLLLTFDVPVTIDGLDYFPGQIAQWESGVGFSSHAFEPTWPISSQLRDFSVLPDAGVVPDGTAAGDTPLLLGKSGGGIELSWGASCLGDEDYAIYEGALGSWFARSPQACSTAGATSNTIPTPAFDAYYLVVAHNGFSEGTYGTGYFFERSQQSGYCYPQAVGTCPVP